MLYMHQVITQLEESLGVCYKEKQVCKYYTQYSVGAWKNL